MNNSVLSHQALLSTKSLTKTYQDGKVITHVLQSINFELYPNSMNSIIGSSGSGKSTLLHLLGGLDSPTSGDIFFKNKSLSQLSENEKSQLRNKEIGFIYQFHHLLGDFSALENVAMPLLIAGLNIKDAMKRANNMLDSVGMLHRSAHRPAELSGGERQRVAIARALINYPSIVMADEPTGNLDQKTAEIIFDLLIQLNQEYGTAFLVVTHDLLLAQKMDQQFMMSNGLLTTIAKS